MKPASTVVSDHEEAGNNGTGDFFYHDLPMTVLKIQNQNNKPGSSGNKNGEKATNTLI